jgi:hypothetical protein
MPERPSRIRDGNRVSVVSERMADTIPGTPITNRSVLTAALFRPASMLPTATPPRGRAAAAKAVDV